MYYDNVTILHAGCENFFGPAETQKIIRSDGQFQQKWYVSFAMPIGLKCVSQESSSLIHHNAPLIYINSVFWC